MNSAYSSMTLPTSTSTRNRAAPGRGQRTGITFDLGASAQHGIVDHVAIGIRTTNHLTKEVINRQLKLDMAIILYKGAVPQLTNVMGGHVSSAVSPMPGVTPFVKGGKLRPIAVTSRTRLASMPKVPTVAERGMPGFEMLSWYGLWDPAYLPRKVVDRLNAAVAKAILNPHEKARFANLSFEAAPDTPEQFGRIIGMGSGARAKCQNRQHPHRSTSNAR